MLLNFSIINLHQTRLNWATYYPCKFSFVSDIMSSRNRWERIKSCLHLRDNNDPTNDDRLFKFRLPVDHLRKVFSFINMDQDLCVNEKMVPFRGRHGMKQFIRGKPKKWGFKFFVLDGVDSYIYDFIPYTGNIIPSNEPNTHDLGASSNFVVHLSKVIQIIVTIIYISITSLLQYH